MEKESYWYWWRSKIILSHQFQRHTPGILSSRSVLILVRVKGHLWSAEVKLWWPWKKDISRREFFWILFLACGWPNWLKVPFRFGGVKVIFVTRGQKVKPSPLHQLVPTSFVCFFFFSFFLNANIGKILWLRVQVYYCFSWVRL